MGSHVGSTGSSFKNPLLIGSIDEPSPSRNRRRPYVYYRCCVHRNRRAGAERPEQSGEPVPGVTDDAEGRREQFADHGGIDVEMDQRLLGAEAQVEQEPLRGSVREATSRGVVTAMPEGGRAAATPAARAGAFPPLQPRSVD